MRTNVIRICLTIFLFKVFSFPLIAQKADTAYYDENRKLVRRVISWTDPTHGRYRSWHFNGRLAGDICFVYQQNGGYIPACDAEIYTANGKLYMKYEYSSNTLNEYKQDKLISQKFNPVKGTYTRDVDYYTNGKIMFERIADKRDGFNPLYISESSGQMGIYKRDLGAIKKMITYYPNGTVLKKYEYIPGDGKNKSDEHQKIYYNPDGSVDPATGESGNRETGTIREFYNNGYPKAIKHLVNGHWNGCQLYWNEKGEVNSHFFPQGSGESWPCVETYENGQLKIKGSNKPGFIIQWDPVNEREYGQLNLPYIGASFYNFEKTAKQSVNSSGTPVKGEGKKKFYSTGKYTCEATFKGGLLEGPFIVYDTSGAKYIECNFSKGMLNGSFIFYSQSGDKMHEGNFKMNEKDGVWNRYNLQRKEIAAQEKWINGKSAGMLLVVDYNQDGSLRVLNRIDTIRQIEERMGYYDGGILSYKSIKNTSDKFFNTYNYRVDGTLERSFVHPDANEEKYIETIYYPSGKKRGAWEMSPVVPVGLSTNWYENGNIKSTGNLNPRKEGEWIYYDSLGNVSEKKLFKKGLEIIPVPSDDPCFCNEWYDTYTFDLTAPLDEISGISEISKRFKLGRIDEDNHVNLTMDSDDGNAITAYGDLKINIDGKDGLVLNLTPCRHGENKVRFNISYNTNKAEGYIPELYYYSKDHTPFEWFEMMVNYKSHQYNYLFSYLLMASINLTKDTASINHFLFKSYNTKLRNVYTERNLESEQFETELNDRLNVYYDSIGNSDYTKNFLSRYFKYFVEPRLKQESLDKLFEKLFFTFQTESDDEDISFYEKESYPDDGIYSLKSFRDRYLLKVKVTADVKHAVIEFPDGILRSIPGNKEAKKERAVSKITIPVKGVAFENFGEEKITLSKSGKACIPQFEISGTGILISADDAVVDFNTLKGPDSLSSFYSTRYPAHEQYSATPVKNFYKNCGSDNKCIYVKRDAYLENFMGVIFPKSKVLIPLDNGKYLEASGSNMLVDGKEINGMLAITKSELAKFDSADILKNRLAKSGLKIIDVPETGTMTSDKEMYIYFRWVK